MTTPREHLIDWLRDAYAMEVQAEKMLKTTADRLEDYPALKARLQQHVAETRNQAAQVELCLHQLDADTSLLKTGIGAIAGIGQAISGIFASDEVVKDAVYGAAFEYFEIINYKALILAANAAGEPGIAATMEQILEEELAMAGWMEDNLPAIMRQYLATGEKH
ncbi:ferritin-like domain-containing protein [Niveispirillum sp. KHB5.9]|uniref:ferritin-like domain-containing protein n=1 Tax=Niveispirillum sp. KHB5.9 TaxID=3400269 RepID=UPI003A85726C